MRQQKNSKCDQTGNVTILKNSKRKKKKLKSKFYKSQKLNIWENWMTLKMGQNSK